MAKPRYADAIEAAGDAAQIRYLFLNTRLPVHRIAQVVGVSPHRVKTVCKDDIDFLEALIDREVAEVADSYKVKAELIAKLRALYDSPYPQAKSQAQAQPKQVIRVKLRPPPRAQTRAASQELSGG